MSWRVARSLLKLRAQVNEAFPARDKTSDGTIGDTSHKARTSDHNPNAAGVVTAMDIDRDFNDGHDGRELVSAIVASKDPRVKYIIFERQITMPGDITRWKQYYGKNAHNHHVHISVSGAAKLYDDPSPTKQNFKTKAAFAPPTPEPRIFKRGMRGDGIRALQNALVERGFIPKSKVDGVFGPKTEIAVKQFQSAHRLLPDGIAGTMTLRELGL